MNFFDEVFLKNLFLTSFSFLFFSFCNFLSQNSGCYIFFGRQVSKTGWLIDFNGISARLGIFHAPKLGNHIHTYLFCVVVEIVLHAFLLNDF